MTLFKLDTTRWHVIRAVFLLASILITTSLGLAVGTGDERWLWLTALVGVMQGVFAFTGYCPAAIVLAKAGLPQS